jgi:hypothetical protein
MKILSTDIIMFVQEELKLRHTFPSVCIYLAFTILCVLQCHKESNRIRLFQISVQ